MRNILLNTIEEILGYLEEIFYLLEKFLISFRDIDQIANLLTKTKELCVKLFLAFYYLSTS